MNANRSNPLASHGVSRTTAAASLDALTGATPGRSQDNDSAAFQRWMAQYRGSQPLQADPAQGAAATPVARDEASRAYQPPLRAAQQLDMKAGQEAPKAEPAPHAQADKAPTRQPVKTPAKPVSRQAEAKPAERKPEPTREASAEGEPPSEADAISSQGKDVQFSTTQGEATAWMKELQPPADVPAGDPAAMLAWLATLTQSHQQSAAIESGEVMGEMRQPVASRADADPRASGLPLGGLAGWAGLQADARAQSESGGRQPGADTSGELDIAALGMTAVSEGSDPNAALAFGALLNREVQQSGMERGEGGVLAHHTATLNTPLDSPEFPKALSDRLSLWVTGAAAEGPMTAELTLNPAEMGPVHISITLDGQTAHVDFAAAAAETRQAIEASLGQLSSALEEAGLSLSGGGVSDQTPQQQAWAQAADGQSGGRSSERPSGRWGETVVDDEVAAALNPSAMPRSGAGKAGGLDLYA